MTHFRVKINLFVCASKVLLSKYKIITACKFQDFVSKLQKYLITTFKQTTFKTLRVLTEFSFFLIFLTVFAYNGKDV